MKTRLITTLLVATLLGVPGFAQMKNPVGTLWLRDNVYIDQAPVLNVNYREYEYFMRTFAKFNLDTFQAITNAAPYFGNDLEKLLDTIRVVPNPDSTTLKVNQASAVSWCNWIDYKTYLNGPAFNFYPFVNVSQELAIEFCKWRTMMVQLLYSTETSRDNREQYHKNITYRLPTQNEWEYALSKFQYTGILLIKQSKKSGPLGEVKRNKSSFIITNLSELVAEKNIVKGCSWKQADCISGLNATFTNTAPADWITFRCVCDVED